MDLIKHQWSGSRWEGFPPTSTKKQSQGVSVIFCELLFSAKDQILVFDRSWKPNNNGDVSAGNFTFSCGLAIFGTPQLGTGGILHDLLLRS